VAAVVVVVWPEHETSVFNPTACLVVRAWSVDFRLFFYSPHVQSVRDYESCRARGIANIRLIISPLIVCSSVPLPGPLITQQHLYQILLATVCLPAYSWSGTGTPAFWPRRVSMSGRIGLCVVVWKA
jgi:hypothetical protein